MLVQIGTRTISRNCGTVPTREEQERYRNQGQERYSNQERGTKNKNRSGTKNEKGNGTKNENGTGTKNRTGTKNGARCPRIYIYIERERESALILVEFR